MSKTHPQQADTLSISGSSAASASGPGMRHNNFDLLRFLFAFVVFLVHAATLSGAETLSGIGKILSSEIAVQSFFVISGFLIFMSYENSRDFQSYFTKRVRRIYPAYCFVITACVVLGFFFSTATATEYLSFPTLKYWVANLLFLNFLQPNLPGLFTNNVLQAVNGALWTLKIEVMFYLSVPLVVMAFRKFGRLPVMVLLYANSLSYSLIMAAMAGKTGSGVYLELQRQLPGQFTFFIAGAAAFYYFQYLARYAKWLVAIALAAFIMQAWLPWAAIQALALGILVIYFACVIPSAGHFGKYGDFSYGIYIVHFPILQLLISYNLFESSPWMMLLVSATLVIFTAYLLWHFVEKPFLRKSSHYVAENQK